MSSATIFAAAVLGFLLLNNPAAALSCVDIETMPIKEIPADALEICKREALQGDLFAMESLASSYAVGGFAPKDESEAFKWSKKAEANGSTKVFSYLYDAYKDGVVVPVNKTESLKYLLLDIEHQPKRFSNRGAFGNARIVQMFGSLRRILDKMPIEAIINNDADADFLVEAATRADKWDEDHGYKKFTCLKGDTICKPRKLE